MYWITRYKKKFENKNETPLIAINVHNSTSMHSNRTFNIWVHMKNFWDSFGNIFCQYRIQTIQFVNDILRFFSNFTWWLRDWVWSSDELERLRLFVSVIVCVCLQVENSMFGFGVASKTAEAGGGSIWSKFEVCRALGGSERFRCDLILVFRLMFLTDVHFFPFFAPPKFFAKFFRG